MEFLSKNLAKRVISKAENIQMSQEQLNILNEDLSKPLLVNAIAGSGKTTTFMIKIMYLILTGELHPKSVMGITFSKKSQQDMKYKYRKMVNKISDDYNVKNNVDLLNMLNTCYPSFSTFHALFFRLINISGFHGNRKILQNNKKVYQYLYNNINNKAENKSSSKEIKDIFKLKEKMINKRYSTDGLSLTLDGNNYSYSKNVNDFIKTFNAIKEKTNHINANNKLIKNYFQCIEAYVLYKKKNNLIDFADMKSLIFNDIFIQNRLEFYRQKMKKCKYIVLDEFQDIDMMQWEIIKNIISNSALNSLTVIGDDDQSIYSFRGSNPDYILNFDKKMKKLNLDVNVKKLTTNYRTGGKILKTTVPMIENNIQRINKNIKPFSTNMRKGIVYISRNLNMYIAKILNDLDNTKYSENDIAIITRYNDSTMFLKDKLADNHVYVYNQNNGYILQNNLYYKIIVKSINAFYFKNFDIFVSLSKEIGFSNYSEHVKNIYGKGINNFDDYFKYSNMILKESIDKKLISSIKKNDNIVKKTIKNIQEIDNKLKDDIDSIKFKNIIKNKFIRELKVPLKNYFSYMLKNNFISSNTINSINEYLKIYVFDLWKSTKDIKDFIAKDNKKREIFNSNNLTINSNINKVTNKLKLLSIHQSKGLEFKHVYLFDQNNRELKQDLFYLEKHFNPKMCEKDFINKIKNMDSYEIKSLENVYINNEMIFKGYKNLCNNISSFKYRYKSYDHNSKTHKKEFFSVLQIVVNEFYKSKQEDEMTKTFQDNIHNMFLENRELMNIIEEERRLLYVAITRAKEQLFLDLPLNASPLLRELDLTDCYMLSNMDEYKNGKQFLFDWKKDNDKYIKSRPLKFNINNSRLL
ncbi:hypothetical protein DY052_05870 [Apilactobacillus timberlakei]|uniref:ATP-dependent helicase n=1 Tax=Apilactobacillus timberlakei TaxID=2008380 RepID=UPI001125E1E9|nr:ATP-dependent helicase [Apilactobacillus timberlakei]TPR14950.1 hypothetical protein DY052_05870 [Apilactobacillus timberlakei]